MKYDLKETKLTVYFEGEINSTNADAVEQDFESTVQGKKFDSLVLNFEKVTDLSSAGLRVILKIKKMCNNVSIVDVSLEVYDILQMTGFTEIIPTKKALKTISLEGAEIIGEGYFSTVYRIDKDMIIKVFERTSDPEQIERELRLAKEAFVLGVPTAISFDIVKVDNGKLGVRFEMLDCMSLKTAVATYPDKIKEYVDKYAALLKKINSTECLNPNIPDIKELTLKKIEKIKPFLEEKYYLKAKKMIEKVEDRKTFVHGDCHFKNIMIQQGEFILIDMDTLSVGHPIFELAALYAPYCAFNEDEPGNSERFFGIKNEDAIRLYNATLDRYFGKDDKVIKDKIRIVSYIHMLWWNRTNEPENEVRLKGCRERLYKLLDQYDDVNF